jgi:hypothetical protein
MKSLIKQLLRENIGINTDPLYIEGKKYFPNLVLKNTATHYDITEKPRFFINPKRNKGSYTYNSFKNILAAEKRNKTINWLKDKGKVDNFVSSMSTNSVYFTFNGKPVRISDHSKETEAIDIIIKWDTQIFEIINQLKSLLK